MFPRFALVAALTLVCGHASAASFGARPAPGLAVSAPMTFYVVRGAPDSCGRGCDRWIAVEGQVDSNAAARFRKFLSQQRDRSLPIYFYSPGGNLDQAVAMGNMLREKPTVARVGRTVVRECGFEAQDSEVCIKLKQSARELHGDLFTHNAMCASACPYLILGAATREIAPDAALGVHSPKVVVSFRGAGKPTPSMVAAATERGRERGDRLLAGYFAKMGADAALLDLSRTVKFEDMHVLTREEIVRFGIDRREFVETSWSFENNGRSTVRKVAVQRNPGEKSFRADAVAADLFRQRALRAGCAAAGNSESDLLLGCDCRWRRQAAVFFLSAGQGVGLRSVGHADGEGLGAIASGSGASRVYGVVGCRGRTPHSAIHETLQRRIVGCAG